MTTPEREEHIANLKRILDQEESRLQLHLSQEFGIGMDAADNEIRWRRRGVRIRRTMSSLRLAIRLIRNHE